MFSKYRPCRDAIEFYSISFAVSFGFKARYKSLMMIFCRFSISVASGIYESMGFQSIAGHCLESVCIFLCSLHKGGNNLVVQLLV